MFWVTFKNRELRNVSRKVETRTAAWQLLHDAHPDRRVSERRVRTATVDTRGNLVWEDVTGQF
ncbi:hypothetical protein SEA_GALACTICA_107 [Streptomyces phage Galactica]|nr:hypothetical protein SEA_GALACTICA_107 [Streptomyces phage Galactica]